MHGQVAARPPRPQPWQAGHAFQAQGLSYEQQESAQQTLAMQVQHLPEQCSHPKQGCVRGGASCQQGCDEVAVLERRGAALGQQMGRQTERWVELVLQMQLLQLPSLPPSWQCTGCWLETARQTPLLLVWRGTQRIQHWTSPTQPQRMQAASQAPGMS